MFCKFLKSLISNNSNKLQVRLLSQNKTNHNNNDQLTHFFNDERKPLTTLKRFKNNSNTKYDKKFIYKGKSDQFITSFNEDNLEEISELDQDLELFSKNKRLYHQKVIDEDIKQRKRIKYGIIKKKMNILHGNKYTYFNLLTWDAKEQIKYLHLNEPGKLSVFTKLQIFYFIFIRYFKTIGQ
jgi:hypothetical protein